MINESESLRIRAETAQGRAETLRKEAQTAPPGVATKLRQSAIKAEEQARNLLRQAEQEEVAEKK